MMQRRPQRDRTKGRPQRRQELHSKINRRDRSRGKGREKPKAAQQIAEPKRGWDAVRSAATARIILVMVVLGVAAVAVIGRAYQLQISRGAEYSAVAAQQAVASKRIQAKRGVIKDRHGAELAITVDVDSVYAEPRAIHDPKMAAAKLAPILGVKQSTLERRLSSGKSFVYLRRRVGPEVSKAVMGLGLPGIATKAEPQRFYSHREMAAHILGFTNLVGEGQAGVERTQEAVLRGKTFDVPGLRDALGNRVFSDGFVPQAALEGDDVVLTIDRQIQHAAEVELARAVVESEGKAGVAIVMDPENGDLLGLASYPSYNPNNLSGATADKQLNRAVSAVFEPGSTMKMVTVAAALEAGVVRPEDRINCEEGRWRVGGRTIRDGDHKYGELSIAEILKVSSNICTAKIGLALGRDRLHEWVSRFGFGEKTGVELPGELKGLVRAPERWREITVANVAFGQGLSVTPIQITQAAAIIANGGHRVAPRIVRAVVDKTGVRTEAIRPSPERVLSPSTAGLLKKMLREVTQEGGTATHAAIPGFEVGGKTGTAQKIDPVTKAYSRSAYVASFVGFVPLEAPRVVVLVLIDEPKRSIYGGVVAAPAFRQIALAALSSLEVYPEAPDAREAFLATYRRLSKEVESEQAADLPLDVALSPKARALLGAEPLKEGTLVPDAWDEGLSPADDEPERGEAAEAGGRQMPNFADLPLPEVLKRSAGARCDLVLSGTGRAVKQTPPAGTLLEKGARCEVVLSPRG